MFESMSAIDTKVWMAALFSCLGQPKIDSWIHRLLCRSFQFHKLTEMTVSIFLPRQQMFSEEPLHVSVKNDFIVNMQITAYTALAF